ncbi:hypothetical protein T11_1825 [Trichinella zimbabwensis]|uniref:Uncharacterized protein n=1 Tax=Trichinella zimbabwensis TaxID=268475 RepID=A0A0V1F7T1_9BILA|nr:hypothetical protein T11_1825 [Trichinella zimbabwensis]
MFKALEKMSFLLGRERFLPPYHPATNDGMTRP